MSNIEWVDKPPKGRTNWDSAHRAEVRKFAAELKRRPGQWAVYPWTKSQVSARAMASRISNGKISAFKHGFRGVCRGDVTYVRYEGVEE